MKIIIIIFFIIFLNANNCNDKLFSLKTIEPISINKVLSQLASQCNFSIVTTDKKAENILHSKINYINIKNVSFMDLVKEIFAGKNVFISFKNKTLYISYYKSVTFNFNYLLNKINGSTQINSNNGNTINSKYVFDFWKDLKNHIEIILKNEGEFKEPIIDKYAGLITVTGNKKQIKLVKEYIHKLKQSLNKEVFIDVRIYSVDLSKSHTSGIDWSKLSISLPDSSVPLNSKYIIGKESIFNTINFSIGGLIKFLGKFGNVNSISNPKIAVLNNQKAMISVGSTINYKYLTSTDQTDKGVVNTYKIESKFVGVTLDITPQIDENNNIILTINPEISSFLDITQLNSSRDMPPDTKQQTLMTVVRMKPNQTLVLGGLITDDRALKKNGVPILREIPIIKYLFSSEEKISSRKELVFVITPHIIDLSKKISLKKVLGYEKLPSLEELNE